MSEQLNTIIDNLFRTEYGRIVAYLTSKFGFHFFEEAEDVAQETLLTAFQKWSLGGIPENPKAWIFLVAKNKAINRLKRLNKVTLSESQFKIASSEYYSVQIEEEKEIEDGMLRMMFACCSAKIDDKSTVVLILSTLCGFSRKEIAKAFLSDEETIKKRLYRSKKKIRASDFQLNIGNKDTLKDKIPIICNALYLVFNEGYSSSGRHGLIRKDVCLEAMRLTQLLIKAFPDFGEISALFALMCLHAARFESRIDGNGSIVLFEEQNRELWNQELIKVGITYLAKSSKGNRLSPYHIEAGIAAEHCLAKSLKETNWVRIKELYQNLLVIKPLPIIRLNLAIVNSKLGFLDEAISEAETLKESSSLSKYYLLYATLGEFYKLKKQTKNSKEHFEKAGELTTSEEEKRLISSKIDLLEEL